MARCLEAWLWLFIILLVLAAIVFTASRKDEANRLAEAAYYSLVVSVILASASMTLEVGNPAETWSLTSRPAIGAAC